MTARPFVGTATLYGQDALTAFSNAHAYVIGVGGVGSWVAEGLARTGVGTITLIDMDVLALSNINRQLPALHSTLGESKVAAMAARLTDINPDCHVNAVDDFLTQDNVHALLPNKDTAQALKKDGKTVLVLDCTDDMNAKLAIALHCRFNKIKLVVAGGAGGKINPACLTVADLRDTYQDPLLAKLREKLKARGINRAAKDKFGIKCVFSSEPPNVQKACQSGLHCGGYGSSVVVTCSMGMIMTATALSFLT